MEDPSGDLAKMRRQMDSVLSPSREVVSALEELKKSESAISKHLEQQESMTGYVMNQQILLSQSHHDYLDEVSKIAESFKQTASELARASQFARASTAYVDSLETTERFRLPRFEFPAFPELTLPEWPHIDWKGVMNSHSKGALRMADRGWTVAAWMSLPDIPALGEASDDEIDGFFVKSYLGSRGESGELKTLSNDLLTSSEISPWRGLLEEVFSCILEGRYKVCVPSLVTVIEGFAAQCLYKQLNTSRRELKVAGTLKKAKWHEEESFTGIMWLSVVTFLDHLFAHSDFESTTPQFINRHWILHGRSAIEWTATDALKLANALATLHWLAT